MSPKSIPSFRSLLRRAFLLLPLLLSVVLICQFLGVSSGSATLFGLVLWAGCSCFLRLRNLLLLVAGLASVAAIGYFVQQPSNERDWKPEVARLPQIEIEGETLHIANLRDFNWSSRTEFAERWTQATYDLESLESLDAIVVPFGDSELAAHVMLSFGFADGRQLVVSVETRPERGEAYSLTGGAARQLELIYVFGTEPDLLGLRILHRGDRVYAFPLDVPQSFSKQLLLELCASANQLRDEPEFYATLRHNCTTTLLRHVNRISDEPIAVSREIIFPAQLGKLLHRLNFLDTNLGWPVAKARYRVDESIRSAEDLTHFSETLRSVRDKQDIR